MEKIHDRRSKDALERGQYAAIDVPDPYDPAEKITVLRQLRGDPLARLHTHHQIDDAQYFAGRAYQRDWERAERGARAIDPTREAVDGGQLPEPLTETQEKARMRLIEIRAALGRRMYAVAHAVLIDGQHVEAIALAYGKKSESWALYYGRMFRDALDLLAVEYRLASRPRSLPFGQISR